MPPMDDTPPTLDELIDDTGLSLSELATRSGVSERTLWSLRNRPTCARATTVNRLAKALGVKPAKVRRAIGRM
jgi:lambda repressor-like predicted transcriptional regulator